MKKVLLILLGLILLGWGLTWGVALSNATNFGYGASATDEDVLYIIDVNTHETNFGIPFFLTYVFDRKPYDLNIKAYSTNLTLQTIYIKTVDIKYNGQSHKTIAVDRSKPFLERMVVTREGGEKPDEIVWGERAETRSQLEFPDIIKRSESFSLRIKGTLFYDNGFSKNLLIDVPFRARNEFELMTYREAMNID